MHNDVIVMPNKETFVFTRHIHKGKIVSVEGLDGFGKSTLVRNLAARLRAEGHTVLTVREPGGSSIGDQLRAILLEPENQSHMSRRTALFMFLASRAQLMHEVVEPALAEGTIVIYDRWIDSTMAYQGAQIKELDMETLFNMNIVATNNHIPDVTLLLQMPIAEAQLRMSNRPANPKEVDVDSTEWMDQIRFRYGLWMLWLNHEGPYPMIALNSQQTPEDLTEAAYQTVLPFILTPAESLE